MKETKYALLEGNTWAIVEVAHDDSYVRWVAYGRAQSPEVATEAAEEAASTHGIHEWMTFQTVGYILGNGAVEKNRLCKWCGRLEDDEIHSLAAQGGSMWCEGYY